jgi:hypothetical protein
MLLSLPSVLAQGSGWPRTLPLEQGMVTIYPLQVDEMSDDIIHFRAALAYRATAGSEPVFGAGWFESKVEIDSSNRIVHPTDLKVTETRFPAGTDDVQSELSAVFAQQSPTWNLDFSLDELEAALKTAEAESKAAQNLNTAPPQIVYRDHPALLISMDGEPVLREVENSPFKAVINTPYPLIFDGKHYYLNAAQGVWYRADTATGPYQFETSPPADIAAMVNADEPGAAEEQPVEPVTAANAPEIVVSTEPTELIVTEGPAAFVPLVDDLLVLQNSDDDVFMHVNSQKFYIVLAGRWYHASSLNGPWTYQPADDLPVAFANIPRESDQADSRVYVAGTEEARDAVLDAQVPQTASVARGEVDIEVEYDGEPIYEPVDGTELVYIENTGSTVIRSDGLYYLVEDGVWYVSSTPSGPWQVSDHRPAQVDTILPTSPVYNAKYVRVYDSTPSVVYVGYTPGYIGSYVYHNTIFYGSGWYYPPWVSPYYYYPRHSTWGFNVSYNYWSGWNFGLSWGWGPFSVGYYTGGYWHHNQYWHHRYYGRWGPGGYRPRPVHYGRHGYGRNRYSHNGYRRGDYGGSGRGRSSDGRNGDGRRADGGRGDGGRRANAQERNSNLYRDGAQRARIADTRDNQPRTPGGRAGDTRRPNYSSASGSQKQKYARQNKVGQNKAGPVGPSDLRVKADVRNANFKASRSNLFADNSGNVYRKADSGPDRNDAISRSSQPARSTKNRKTPSPRNNGNDNRKADRSPDRNNDISRSNPPARSTKNRNTPSPRNSKQNGKSRQSGIFGAREKSVSKNEGRTSSRAKGESSVKRTTQSTDIVSSRQSQTRTADNRARQRPSPSLTAPVRQSQPRTSSYSARQRPPKSVSAPTQKQHSSRPSAPPQIARNSGRTKSAPSHRAPQRSTQKTSGQRSWSNGRGGKHAGGSRSRR